MARIKEVLQTNEWASNHQGDFSTDFLLDSDEDFGFDNEASELEREMLGLKLAIEKGADETGAGEPDLKNHDEEDELHVEKIDGLMLRMKAIKGEEIHIPYIERGNVAFRISFSADLSTNISIDMAAELPEAERKAFAVKAINDIIKDI